MHFSNIREALDWQKIQHEKSGSVEAKHKKAFWKKWAIPLFIVIAGGALFFANASAAWIFLSASLLSIGVFYRKK
ncbi:MAG TPA: hypothetical protein VJJ82_00675 [Candidatus Nanoarchaeia archaeon]|nr:hypothetical protein [Candidatus Nanoarchaeia archaeon]